jgi:hypothetical protein
VLVLRRAHGLELVDHVLQEEQRAIVHTREPGAKAAVEAALVVLLLDLLLLLLPVHAEGRIREEVVEGLTGKLIVREAVTESNILAAAIVIDLLHEHVRRGGCESPLVVVLTIDVQPCLVVMLAKIILRFCQHAAGAASRIEQLAYRSRRSQQLVVIDEEDVYHEPDHFSRCEVVPGCLVG